MAHLAELVKTADQLCALHRCEEAATFWEEASSLKPSEPDIHHQLALCYSRD